MRLHVAKLGLVGMLGGCSLIYNPNNIDKPAADAADAPPEFDAFVADADPTKLEIMAVGPTVLFEGQGTGGSRQAILTLVGHHLIEGAQVELIATGGENVLVTVDNANSVLAPTRDVLAVPITLPIDPLRPEGTVAITIKITQGATVKMFDSLLSIKNLDELTAAAVITDPAQLKALYSDINHPAAITLTAGAGKPAAKFRAVTSIVLGDIFANASGTAPGPGGFPGGALNVAGGGMGGGPAGAALKGGSGAGFSAPGTAGANNTAGPMIGERQVKGYATNHGSGGGGGANGVGGGGGGTIEITAGGDVQVAKVEVKGFGGGAGGLGAAGGGGAGGAIVIRAGRIAGLTGTVLDARGGAGATGTTGNGGAGALGRVRIDAPMVMGMPTTMASAYHGVSFDQGLAPTTKRFNQPIVAYGTIPDQFKVFVLNAAGNSTTPVLDVDFATASISINPILSQGYNRVCVTANATVSVEEATNCIDLAYLP